MRRRRRRRQNDGTPEARALRQDRERERRHQKDRSARFARLHSWSCLERYDGVDLVYLCIGIYGEASEYGETNAGVVFSRTIVIDIQCYPELSSTPYRSNQSYMSY